MIRRWRRTSTVVRWSCYGLAISAVMLVSLGLVGDWRGWWEDRPFLTNLVTTAAGGCVGIAVALFVIQWLLEVQAEVNQRRNACRLLIRSVGRLRSSLALVTTPTAPEDFGDAIEPLILRYRSALAPLDRIVSDAWRRQTAAKDADFIPVAMQVVEDVHGCIEKMAALLPSREHVLVYWNGAVAEWKFLDSHVKPGVLEAPNGRWLNPEEFGAMYAFMADVRHFSFDLIRKIDSVRDLVVAIRELSTATDGSDFPRKSYPTQSMLGGEGELLHQFDGIPDQARGFWNFLDRACKQFDEVARELGR